MLFDYINREGKSAAPKEILDYLELEWGPDWDSERIEKWMAELNADIDEYLRLQRKYDNDL